MHTHQQEEPRLQVCSVSVFRVVPGIAFPGEGAGVTLHCGGNCCGDKRDRADSACPKVCSACTHTHTHTRTHAHTHTHACAHTHAHTHTHTHARTHACAHTHTHTHTHARARTHACAHAHTHTHTHTCTHTHTHTHAHMHTHTHTHTHTCCNIHMYIRADCPCTCVLVSLHLCCAPLVGCRYGIRGTLHLQDKEERVACPVEDGAGVTFDKGWSPPVSPVTVPRVVLIHVACQQLWRVAGAWPAASHRHQSLSWHVGAQLLTANRGMEESTPQKTILVDPVMAHSLPPHLVHIPPACQLCPKGTGVYGTWPSKPSNTTCQPSHWQWT